MESTLTVTPDGAPAPAALATYSRFVQRLQRRYQAELPLMPPGLPVRAHLQACLDALRAQPGVRAVKVAIGRPWAH